MAIKFNCGKCGTELNVKDEFAGKQGKCPGCKSVVTVPSASKPAGRKPADDDEVVEAGVVEDEDEVDEDESPRRKKGSITSKPSSRRRDDDDEDEDDDEPRSKSKKKRRDEDEDEDEDDRPRKKSKSRRDEDEEEDEDRPKLNPKKRRAAYRRAALGAKLTMFGLFATVGGLGVAALVGLIYSMAMGSKGGGGEGLATIIKIFNYLIVLALLAGLGLRIGGSACMITTPGTRGEMAFAISCVSTAGLAAIMMLILVLRFFDDPFGFAKLMMFIVAVVEFNPLMGIEGSGGGGGMPLALGFTVYVLPLLEVAWLVLFGLYQWAVGKSLKDRETRSKGMLMVIISPSVCGGMGLLLYLLFKIEIKSPVVGMMFIVLYLLVIGGMLIWYTLVVSGTKRTLESAK